MTIRVIKQVTLFDNYKEGVPLHKLVKSLIILSNHYNSYFQTIHEHKETL